MPDTPFRPFAVDMQRFPREEQFIPEWNPRT